MRRLLFLAFCLGVLAFSGIRAEEAVENTEIDHADVLSELDDDVRIDLARMLDDLFEIDEDEDDADDDASVREGRAEGDDKSMNEPKDLGRYNSFIDTFFRRLNSYSRSRFDPLGFVIGKKADNKGSNKKKSKVDKKKKNADKKKKGSRHPKDLNLDEIEVEAEEVEETVEVREKREVEMVDVEEIEEVEEEEDSLDREKRDAEEETEVEEEVGRKGKPARGNKKNNNNRNSNNNSNTRKNKNKKSGSKNKRNNNNNNNNKKDNKRNTPNKGKKAGNKKNAKKGKTTTSSRNTRAFVTGLATLARSGDVMVRSSSNGKMIKADFRMGPIDLKVSRKFGAGKDAVVRNARAASPQLEGRIAIKVSSNGKAKVSAFKVKKPAIVQVDGSLSRSDKNNAKNNFMENSIGKFTPIAAQKLKLASRAVLKVAEPKNQE